MSIFKAITIRYCEKIFNLYKEEVDKTLYPGKEAELLIKRNEFAQRLMKAIKEIEIQDNDYTEYFKKIVTIINSTFEDVEAAVKEYNEENKTKFTTDFFGSALTPNLKNFVEILTNLVPKSPEFIKEINDESLFKNCRDIPWVNQFSFILYEYILDKELEIITNKAGRDIFDMKIQLIFKYIENASTIASSHKDENDNKYKELMKILLKSMRSEEQAIQCRKQETGSPSGSSYYAVASFLYKASEKVVGKNILGQKIDQLIDELNERTKIPAQQNI